MASNCTIWLHLRNSFNSVFSCYRLVDDVFKVTIYQEIVQRLDFIFNLIFIDQEAFNLWICIALLDFLLALCVLYKYILLYKCIFYLWHLFNIGCCCAYCVFMFYCLFLYACYYGLIKYIFSPYEYSVYFLWSVLKIL